MSSLFQWRKSQPSSRGVKLLVACTVSLATLLAQPAFADHDNDRDARGEREHSDRGYDRGRERGHERGRSGHYRREIYRPEPVYYPRQESPGISLFFPFWDR
jgi:hypothetical protein